jgi:4-hydroxy-2-oxoheptanedioate aldolase
MFDHPTYRAAVDRVVAAANAAGKTAGIFLASVDDVPQALADGFRMISLSSDGGLLMQAARTALHTARSAA